MARRYLGAGESGDATDATRQKKRAGLRDRPFFHMRHYASVLQVEIGKQIGRVPVDTRLLRTVEIGAGAFAGK